MAEQRQRWQGSAEELAEALDPVARRKGRVMLIYDDSPKCQKALLSTDRVYAAHQLLEALHGLAPRLHFVRSTVKEAMQAILDRYGDSWKLVKDADRRDWVETLTKRVMNITRSVSQGEVTTPSAKWVLELPWNKSKKPRTLKARASRVDTDGEEAAAKEDRVEYEYGFSTDLSLPWTRAGTRHATPKPGAVVLREQGDKDDDPIRASWPDGTIKSITACTWGEWSTTSSAKHAPVADVLYASEHSASHHRLLVKPRMDRGLLVSLYEQNSHIGCVRVALLSTEADEPPDCKNNHHKVAALMIRLTKRYEKNEFLRSDLYARRNEMLQERGLSVRVRPGLTLANGGRSMKRLAGAEKEASRACDADADPDDEESDAKVKATPTLPPFNPLEPFAVGEEADDVDGEDLWSGDDLMLLPEEEAPAEPKPKRSKRARGKVVAPAVDECDPVAPEDAPTTPQPPEETQREKLVEPNLRGHLQRRLEFSSGDDA